MDSKKLLSLVLGLPLALTGCSSMYHTDDSQMASSDGVMVEEGYEDAMTSGAGAYDRIKGTDMTMAEADLLKEVIFYFDFDKSDLKNESDFEALRAHAKYLTSHPAARIRLEGHTDERGSREYNIALGERRSQAIARVLMLDGAAKDQIAMVSYGEEKPAKQGHDEAAWQYNRRAVIVYEAS